MTLWRLTFHLAGTTLSAWQADTVWGHLCWALRHREGEPALHDWIDRYRAGSTPLLISDGFPGELLPAPLFPFAPARETPADGPESAPRPKRMAWLTRGEFLEACRTGAVSAAEQRSGWCTQVSWKNTVSRASNSAYAEHGSGGLFALREMRPPKGRITLYARVEPEELERVRALFDTFVVSGFGKRRVVGHGNVSRIEWAEETELGREDPEANGFVTLASFVPRREDPTDGAWRLRTKHGRFGDAMPGVPWKKPLLFIDTGSSFYTPSIRPHYGGLVEGIAWEPSSDAQRNAVQYAYAFPIPAHLPGRAVGESAAA